MNSSYSIEVCVKHELIDEATTIIDRAETQQRDLSDFESGRVDALLEVAYRYGGKSNSPRSHLQ